ncbi:MAG: ribonuclease H-like domain-containing protein [Nanoarchaeota archaeon]|nr:ribonuclease H-like domain-containing protein [Nanoarchaeota archaeon]
MIRNSFIMLRRIKEGMEKKLWNQGITSWNKFIFAKKIKGISQARKLYYQRFLSKAGNALYNFDSSYFKSILPSTETWRLYDFFKEDAVFIDIEISGMAKYDNITVIGLFDGMETKIMIKGVNLDTDVIKEELSRYKIMLSFNGSSLDLPYIKKRFPGLLPDIPHIDLRHCCARVGLKGGLKDIEKQLGIKRANKIVERMYGGDPLKLWKMHKATGDDYYLNLLVSYNEEDIINLKPIADYCYKNLKEECKNEFRTNITAKT